MSQFHFPDQHLLTIAESVFGDRSIASAVREQGRLVQGTWVIGKEDFDSILSKARLIKPRAAPAPQPPALAREADPVSWLTKAKNFATATAKHIAAGMPTASDEEILRRWTICQGCEFLKNDACSKCGCPVARDRRFVSKLAWADQSCPVGKWGPADT